MYYYSTNMRSILSISLPSNIVKQIKAEADNLGISVSKYFLELHLLKKENLISERDLLARIKNAESNFQEGNVKKLNSLEDLMEDKAIHE